MQLYLSAYTEETKKRIKRQLMQLKWERWVRYVTRASTVSTILLQNYSDVVRANETQTINKQTGSQSKVFIDSYIDRHKLQKNFLKFLIYSKCEKITRNLKNPSDVW